MKIAESQVLPWTSLALANSPDYALSTVVRFSILVKSTFSIANLFYKNNKKPLLVREGV